jgi:hypothetical protein
MGVDTKRQYSIADDYRRYSKHTYRQSQTRSYLFLFFTHNLDKTSFHPLPKKQAFKKVLRLNLIPGLFHTPSRVAALT